MALQIKGSRVYSPASTNVSVSAVLAGSTTFARTPSSVTGVTPSAPLNITTGGTYTGTYQSNNVNTPAVTISTTQPVTLSRMRIIGKGNGIFIGIDGVQLTIADCVFEQQDPGAVVNHRAVYFQNPPASFDFQHNLLTDTDGIFIGGASGGSQMNSLTVSYNMCINVGRYPHPTATNCCVQFLQLASMTVPGGQVWWNHTQNLPGQSDIEDNINFYVSGGTDSTHRIDVAHNLIDGAYPKALNNADFTGGGINLGDGGGGSGVGGAGHNTAHDNVVVSTTNYGISVNGPDNYATNNVCINDGAEQTSNFGQAIIAWPDVTPTGVLHATGTSYNWHRFVGDPQQWPCYTPEFGSGTQVSMTEQQARDSWEASRAAAGVIVGPRSTATNRPTNPVLLNYLETGDPGEVTAAPSNWAHPGALIVTGRTNYNDTWVHTAADGGATVLIYLDTIINLASGRYHDKLINSSEFGAAVPLWPPGIVFNTFGSLNDIRTTADGGGILQAKLAGVLQLAITENPHISGFFLDDVGSWGYFSAFAGFSAADKTKYRNGAIAILQTARTVADANDLFLVNNGTFMIGQGGGYPDPAQHGCSLVDGGVIENHPKDAFWAGYANSTQWGAATPRKLPYAIALGNTFTSADKDAWAGNCSHATYGSYAAGTPAPWGGFSDLGLPHRNQLSFVTRAASGNLQLNGTRYRYSGANMSGVGGFSEDNGSAYGGVDGLHWATNAEINAGLDSAKAMGLNVVRHFTAGSVGSAFAIEPTRGNFSAGAFERLDYSIMACKARGIRQIMILVDNWNYFIGGKLNYLNQRGVSTANSGALFFTDATVIADFKNHITNVLNHVNQYNGVAYKNEPTILAWETGNELESGSGGPGTGVPVAWTGAIADHIKITLGARQLVADGVQTYWPDPAALALTSVDIYNTHTYDNDKIPSQIMLQADNVKASNKAFHLGEWGWNAHDFNGTPLTWTTDQMITAIQGNNSIDGSLFWQLEAPLTTHFDGFTLHYPGDDAGMITGATKLRNNALFINSQNAGA